MPTGDRRANIYNKRNMPEEAWDLHFFRFLDDKINDSTRAAFLNSGVLGDGTIGLTGPLPATDVFGLDITVEDRVMDGYGHIMDLGNWISEYGAGALQSFFENSLGVDYYVGIRYQEMANDVERNPRSSEPEYPWFKDIIGEKGAPDSVTDNGTYIRLEIDGILENGVDHSRRPVWVYLNNPVSPDDSIAYYTGTIGYSGGINYVDITYTPTAGPLGQTAPEFPISTDALDYAVIVPGVSWFRNTDISTDSNYAFIGKVTGAGAGVTPTVFDISDQRPVFLISLDRAYRANSLADPAPGRTIYADKGSVVIQQSATASRDEDDSNTGLLFNGLPQDFPYYSFPFAVYLNEYSAYGSAYSTFKNLANLSELLSSESVTLGAASNTVTFTRGAVDLTVFKNDFINNYNNSVFLLVSSSANDQDGLYIVDWSSVTTNTLDVSGLDGSTPSFTAETVTATVLVLTDATIPSNLHGVSILEDKGAIYHRISRESIGLDVSMFGDPNDASKQQFARLGYGSGIATNSNYFFNVFRGSTIMRGGKLQNLQYQDHISWKVRGHAHFLSDKTHGTGDWLPTESYAEWGYDYRGNDFGKESSGDEPAYQWARTDRLPYWAYYAANQYVNPYEPFTRLNNTTLTLTRAGVDLTYLPVAAPGAIGGMIVEVRFDTPNSQDGVYIAYDCPSTSTIELRTLDGQSPTFPAGDGDIRIWAGAITGNNYAPEPSGLVQSWAQTIVPPTRGSGGLRLMHYSGESYSTSQYRWLLYAQDTATPMFGVRDGGVVYGRGITTKGATSGHGLTQWDQVVTSLLHADKVSLFEGTRELEFPTTEASCNVIKRSGGGTWSITKQVSLLKFATSDNTGVPGWESNDASTGNISSLVGDSRCRVPVILPDGATWSSVAFYVNPTTGAGTTASFGVRVYRKAFNTFTPAELVSTGVQYATSAVLHTMTVTLDQNNVIDNNTYAYYLDFEASSSPGDLLGSNAQVVYTIPALGENLFDCF